MTTLFPKQGQADPVRYLSAIVAVLLALFSLAVSAFAAYSHNDKAVTSRIVAVETQQKDDHERARDDRDTMHRIETKLDNYIFYQTGHKP